MMRRFALPAAASCALLLVSAVTGCDPKKVAGESGTDDPDNDPPASVAPELVAVGAVAAFHMNVISAALTESAAFDSGSTSTSLRSAIDTDCVTITLTDSTALTDSTGPVYEMDFAGCTDANGTTYSGTATLDSGVPGSGLDGLRVSPSHTLAASNQQDHLRHTFTQGSLILTFERDGSGNITGVNATNSFRHRILDEEAVNFGYDVAFPGGLGQHTALPRSGGTINVSWNGVGVFQIQLTASGRGQFRLGRDYEVDLSDGTVTFADS